MVAAVTVMDEIRASGGWSAPAFVQFPDVSVNRSGIQWPRIAAEWVTIRLRRRAWWRRWSVELNWHRHWMKDATDLGVEVLAFSIDRAWRWRHAERIREAIDRSWTQKGTIKQ